MTQGDSLYDIIDKRDHAQVQAQLLQTSYPGVHAAVAPEASEERTFFCRMNVARSFRRQAGFGDHKVGKESKNTRTGSWRSDAVQYINLTKA